MARRDFQLAVIVVSDGERNVDASCQSPTLITRKWGPTAIVNTHPLTNHTEVGVATRSAPHIKKYIALYSQLWVIEHPKRRASS
jgi:hypothetical protein